MKKIYMASIFLAGIIAGIFFIPEQVQPPEPVIPPVEIIHCDAEKLNGAVIRSLPFPLWNGTNDSVYISEDKIDILKIVGQETAIQWQDLLSMCIQESTDCSPDTIGDHGRSFGAFQIHSYWNPISDEMKADFEMQARWTATNLRRNRYDESREWSIQAHNTTNDPSYRYSNAVIGRADEIVKNNLK